MVPFVTYASLGAIQLISPGKSEDIVAGAFSSEIVTLASTAALQDSSSMPVYPVAGNRISSVTTAAVFIKTTAVSVIPYPQSTSVASNEIGISSLETAA